MRNEISIEEVVSYMHCPVLYMFKHKTRQMTQLINLNEKFDIDMHKLFYHLFSRLQNGDEVEVAHLKKAWGRLWLSDRKGYDVVIAEPKSWKDTHNMRRKAGISAITYLWQEFLKCDPFDVIVVNQEYVVKIDDDLFLKGTWEVIREVSQGGKKRIEIMDLRVDDTWKNGFFIKNDLKLTADSFAFREMTGHKEDSISIYRGLKGVSTNTTRSADDYNLLKHTVRQISKAISHEIYYPKITPACSTCPFRQACEEYLSADILQTPFQTEGGEQMKLEIPGVGIIDENGKLNITDEQAKQDIKDQGLKIGSLDEITETKDTQE